MDKHTEALMKEMLSTAILMHVLANVDKPRPVMANELGELLFDMIMDILGDADKALKRLEKENKTLRALVRK